MTVMVPAGAAHPIRIAEVQRAVAGHRGRKPRILLLQGPVGGFFKFLQRHLESLGFETRRLIFNAGDLVFSFGTRFEVIRGRSPEALGPFFRDYYSRWRPDAVIVFGDQRPVHVVAIREARAVGLAVWSFEEGYVRPHYVAFEPDGNNAASPSRTTFDRSARSPEAKPPPVFPSHTLAMARQAIVYFAALRVFRFAFPRYVHHRERHLRLEMRVWLRSFRVRFMRRRTDARIVAAIKSEAFRPFFMVALQVHDDLQLRFHGMGWRVPAFLEAVIGSFAQHAPKHTRLLIKLHPLDVGYAMAMTVAQTLIDQHELADRVEILCDGPISRLVTAAAGVVTVNSTVGLQALAAGTPVLSLGNAIYHVDGLPSRAESIEELHRFWIEPPPVEVETAANFVRHLTNSSLLPGSFYRPETWTALVDQVADRLTEELATDVATTWHCEPVHGHAGA